MVDDSVVIFGEDVQIFSAGEQGPVGATGQTGWTGQPRQQTVTYSSSIVLDCNTYDVFDVLLTGNPNIALSGGYEGQKILIRFLQDSTGGRSITLNPNIRFGSDITSLSLTSTPSKKDYVLLVASISAGKYDLVAYARGY